MGKRGQSMGKRGQSMNLGISLAFWIERRKEKIILGYGQEASD
jgi:hypothetical protein